MKILYSIIGLFLALFLIYFVNYTVNYPHYFMYKEGGIFQEYNESYGPYLDCSYKYMNEPDKIIYKKQNCLVKNLPYSKEKLYIYNANPFLGYFYKYSYYFYIAFSIVIICFGYPEFKKILQYVKNTKIE